MLPGLNALKFWLDFKSFGELGSVELDGKGSKWSGRMRGYEGVSKWKITNSKIQANNLTLIHLESGCIKQGKDRLNSMFGYRYHHQT